MGAVLKESKELKPESSTYAEFRARQDGPVFRKDRGRHVETSRLGDGEQQYGALQTIRLKAPRKPRYWCRGRAEEEAFAP